MLSWRASDPIVALQSLSCKHPTAWHQDMPPQNNMLCPLSISLYTPAIPLKSSCKAQWKFFCCCCLLFSLFPLPFIPFKLLQGLMQMYNFSWNLPSFLSFDQILCSHYVCFLFVALQVHIVYLGHNNGLSPSLTSRSHLQLLSRVFMK